jgi:hypothetical protein
MIELSLGIRGIPFGLVAPSQMYFCKHRRIAAYKEERVVTILSACEGRSSEAIEGIAPVQLIP